MASALLKNLVRETANAPGSGTVTLNGAPAGWLTFAAAFGDGKSCFYFIRDAAQSEWGLGVVHVGGSNTLSRDTVLGNSVGSASHLAFAGLVDVYNAVPAERAVTDELVPWKVLGSQVFTTSRSSVAFVLPSTSSRFRLELQSLSASTPAAAFMRFSDDGGTTYKSGASDYSGISSAAAGTATSVSSGLGGYISLTPATAGNVFGFVEFDAVGTLIAEMFAVDTSPRLVSQRTAGFPALAGRATNVLIGFVTTSIAAGNVRLTGA